jgi:hypothetical protein
MCVGVSSIIQGGILYTQQDYIIGISTFPLVCGTVLILLSLRLEDDQHKYLIKIIGVVASVVLVLCIFKYVSAALGILFLLYIFHKKYPEDSIRNKIIVGCAFYSVLLLVKYGVGVQIPL